MLLRSSVCGSEGAAAFCVSPRAGEVSSNSKSLASVQPHVDLWVSNPCVRGAGLQTLMLPFSLSPGPGPS